MTGGVVDPFHFSLIVPVLNEGTGIGGSLARLQGLRAQGVRVIVVDGGSTDGTPAQCEGLCDVLCASSKGRAVQMNHGAGEALKCVTLQSARSPAPSASPAGHVLVFLHADTHLPADALQAIADALAARTGACWGRFDVQISGKAAMLRAVAWMMNLRSRLTGIATGDQTIFVLAREFEAIGGFPEQALMEDIEFSTRLCRRSRPVCLRQRVVTSGRRWEQRGVWRTIVLMWRLRLLYWLGTPATRLAQLYR